MARFIETRIEPILPAEMARLQDEELVGLLEEYEMLANSKLTSAKSDVWLMLQAEIDKLESEHHRRTEAARQSFADAKYAADIAKSDQQDWNARQMECHGYQMACGGAL